MPIFLKETVSPQYTPPSALGSPSWWMNLVRRDWGKWANVWDYTDCSRAVWSNIAAISHMWIVSTLRGGQCDTELIVSFYFNSFKCKPKHCCSIRCFSTKCSCVFSVRLHFSLTIENLVCCYVLQILKKKKKQHWILETSF